MQTKTIQIAEVLDSKQIKGIVTIEVIYADGRREVFVIENMTTMQGLDFYVRNLVGINTVSLNYIVFSNSTTPPDPNETSTPGTWKYGVLATKNIVGPRQARLSASLNGGDSGVSGNTLASLAIAANADGSGQFSRVLTPQISLGPGVTINVNYDIIITA